MKRMWLLAIIAPVLLLSGCVKKLPDAPPPGTPTVGEQERSKSETEMTPDPNAGKGGKAAGGERSSSESEVSPANTTGTPGPQTERSNSESAPSPTK